MTFTLDQLQRLRRLHQAIKNEQTGSAEELTKKLKTSQRTLRYDLAKLKDWGAELCFNRKTKTYRYLKPFELMVNIEVTAKTEEEQAKIFGGGKKNTNGYGLAWTHLI